MKYQTCVCWNSRGSASVLKLHDNFLFMLSQSHFFHVESVKRCNWGCGCFRFSFCCWWNIKLLTSRQNETCVSLNRRGSASVLKFVLSPRFIFNFFMSPGANTSLGALYVYLTQLNSESIPYGPLLWIAAGFSFLQHHPLHQQKWIYYHFYT